PQNQDVENKASNKGRVLIWILAIIALIAVGSLLWYFLGGNNAEPEPDPSTSAPTSQVPSTIVHDTNDCNELTEASAPQNPEKKGLEVATTTIDSDRAAGTVADVGEGDHGYTFEVGDTVTLYISGGPVEAPEETGSDSGSDPGLGNDSGSNSDSDSGSSGSSSSSSHGSDSGSEGSQSNSGSDSESGGSSESANEADSESPSDATGSDADSSAGQDSGSDSGSNSGSNGGDTGSGGGSESSNSASNADAGGGGTDGNSGDE